MQEPPDGATAEIWKRAFLAAMGVCTALITAIGTVFVQGRRDKNGGRRARLDHPDRAYSRERSGLREWRRQIDREVGALRKWRHDEVAPKLTAVAFLQEELDELKADVERLKRE